MNTNIREKGHELTEATRIASWMAERVFAQSEGLIHDDYTGGALALVLRVLDNNTDAREALLAERDAYEHLLFALTATPATDDDMDAEFRRIGLRVQTASLAFRVGRDTATTSMRDGLGEQSGTVFGLPLTVLEGAEFDTRLAAAWLRARPESAGHWAMLEAVLARG